MITLVYTISKRVLNRNFQQVFQQYKVKSLQNTMNTWRYELSKKQALESLLLTKDRTRLKRAFSEWIQFTIRQREKHIMFDKVNCYKFIDILTG
jgi:hypothetical protein